MDDDGCRKSLQPQVRPGLICRWRQHTRRNPNGNEKDCMGRGGTRAVRLWDIATGRALQDWSDHEGGVTAIAFAPDGQTLAWTSYDGQIRTRDLRTGQPVHRLKGHDKTSSALAFSSDGKLLASAGADEMIRLWDPATGAELRAIHAHEGSVRSVVFSPDGKLETPLVE